MAEEPPDSYRDALIQLHIAEYSALTARCTNWITMQFAVPPVALACVAIGFQFWDQVEHRFLLWVGVTVSQIIAAVWNQAVIEQYNAARYLERVLRPLVLELVPDQRVWGFETYLATERGSTMLFEVPLPIIFAASIIGMAFYYGLSVGTDYIFVPANMILLVWFLMKTAIMVRIRDEIVTPAVGSNLSIWKRPRGGHQQP